MGWSETRRVALPDHPAIADLWYQAWHDAHGGLFPPELVRHRTPGSFLGRLPGFGNDTYLVEDRSGPVAFAVIEGSEVDQFYLAPRARGTGLAGRVLDDMEHILASRGERVAYIDCTVGNERARRFYRASGYTEIAEEERPVWMPDGLAATVPTHRLAKRLEP